MCQLFLTTTRNAITKNRNWFINGGIKGMMMRLLVVFALLITLSYGFKHPWRSMVDGMQNSMKYRSLKPGNRDFSRSMNSKESEFTKAMRERMKAEAAALRAEADLLDAEQRQAEADEIAGIFHEFDLNSDGEISEEELRIGLQRVLNMDLTEGKIKQLMLEFDDSGDGALQLEEFKGIKTFKLKLDSLVEQERQELQEEVMRAREEAKLARAAELKAQAVANILNDRTPTMNDRFLSVLPYLFPLADSLGYGEPLFGQNPDSFFAGFAHSLDVVYNSIPFAGLVAFFALASISRNLKLNRLIRFSIQQAIFLDIALIAPGFIGSIGSFLIDVPSEIKLQLNSAVFILFSLTIFYCVLYSLLGIVPNRIPIISQKAEERLPTAGQLERFFDDEGNVRLEMPDEEMKMEDKSSKTDNDD